MSQETYLTIKVYKTMQTLPASVSLILSKLFPCIGKTIHTPDKKSYPLPLSFAATYSWGACHIQAIFTASRRARNSIGGYPRFYRKCQRAIDPLDNYLTPFAHKKRLGHYWNQPNNIRI